MTQIYTKIRQPQLKRAVAFYEDGAERLLSVEAVPPAPESFEDARYQVRGYIRMFLKPWS